MQKADTLWLSALGSESLPAALRFVDLEAGWQGEVGSQLRLSPRFLDITLQGGKRLEVKRRAEIRSRNPQLDLTGKSPRSVDAAFALSAKAKLYLCPFSGTWRQTRKAIGSEAYVGEYQGRSCLILQFCAADHPGADSAFAFPDKGTILYFKSMISEADLRARVSNLFVIAARHAALLQAHLEADEDRYAVAAVEMRTPHFGHYVWNALSAWGHLLPHYSSRIDFFISWHENRFIGSVTDIYPELRDKQVVLAGDESDLVKLICTRSAFAVFVKDNHLTAELAARITAYARRTCPETQLEAVDRLRRSCRIVVLLALRTGNRAWLNQERGYVELARALASKADSVGFVIDGMNKDTSLGWTHTLMSLTDELNIAARIASGIGALAPCITTVGATMAESLVASEACDFYVAPAGSGLAKYKWLANKPGVLISNSVVLDQRNASGAPVRVFEYHRDQIVASRFVRADCVSDVQTSNREGGPHANFELDWKHILEEAEILIRGIGAGRGA